MPRKKQSSQAQQKAPTKSTRRSKLAKENDLTAEEEAEIKEAWSLFRQDDVEEFEDEKEGVIRTDDVNQAMKAQGIAAKNAKELAEFLEILDPESDGYVTYTHFVELCALQLHNKSDETKAEEIEKAYRLFTKGADGPIKLNDLKAIAKTLREDVSDDVLKAMILEANGGAGVSTGVDIEAFQAILTRAGVFQ